MLEVCSTLAVGTGKLRILGAGNIWVEDSFIDRSSVEFSQMLIGAALRRTAPGQLELVVFDEMLTGIAAPFFALQGSGETLLSSFHDAAEFKSHLLYLRDHVQSVNYMMKGETADLTEFRNRVQYPVEGYKLVVISADVSLLDAETQDLLTVLVTAGPRAGVSFLVHSTTVGANSYLLQKFQVVTVNRGTASLTDGTSFRWVPTPAQDLTQTGEHIVDALRTMKMPPVEFTSIVDTGLGWTESSRDGIRFSVGRYSFNPVEVMLGDEVNQRHNVLVTGAVGQGKSNLLSVIIHSICARYSPREVELYLLDFKEGVTLQPYAGINGHYLPHARVLGLDADREFGLSVLLNLFDLYRKRLQLFKKHGVQSLSEYRSLSPGHVMPRVVVVVDEFQLMLTDDDKLSSTIAELLSKSVRLFRAAGIHFVLCSQTIGGNLALMGSVGEGLFNQVPIRIALKNSLSESHATLNPRNDAAAHLRSREAIVNLDYGALSANQKTSVAFADDRILAPLRDRWVEESKSYAGPPFVFDGEKEYRLRDVDALVDELPGRNIPAGLLGLGIQVGNPAHVLNFDRNTGRNAAFIGHGEDIELVLNSVVLSLAHSASSVNKRFIILDPVQTGDPDSRDDLVAGLRLLNADVTVRHDVVEAITQMAEDAAASEETGSIFVIGYRLDKLRELGFDFESLVRQGPNRGIHFIGWWSKPEVFAEHVGYGGSRNFDMKALFKMDAQSARQLLDDPLAPWLPRENRMTLADYTYLDAPTTIIPLRDTDALSCAEGLRERRSN